MLSHDDEKGHWHDSLDSRDPVSISRPTQRPWKLFLAAVALGSLLVGQSSRSRQFGWWSSIEHHESSNHKTWEPVCPSQPPPLVPGKSFSPAPSFRDEAAERLAQAVRIPTVSYDDNGEIGEDLRWDVFYDFHKWLFAAYPSVFESDLVNTTIVNELALLTTVAGEDPSLKPLMLMSHFDVVPAPKETYSRWTYPPFAGAIDAERRFVYGRGASDCKDLVTAQYEALSLLLESGFRPRRTIILAHGVDEETTGRNGARKLAPYLEEHYGKDSMLMIVDEGDSSLRLFGQAFALPGTAEKGYLDIEVAVGVRGGHSSVPPRHSGIGIAADAIKAVEDHAKDEDFAPSFGASDDPILQFHVCAAQHAATYPAKWKKLIKKKNWKGLSKAFAGFMPEAEALIGTTSAIDVISGGVKVNALPELVTFLVDHRIAFSSSVAAVQKHVSKALQPIAKKHNLTLYPFEAVPEKGFPGNGYIQLSIFGDGLEPAPHTPTVGAVWDLFAGSVRHVLKDEKRGDEPYTVSPFASTGNTDTASYWNLSKHIFRYVGGPVEEYASNEHTVDEKVSIDGHLKVVEWIYTLVQNADAFEG